MSKTHKCEFTTDDLGEHGANVSKWLTDNCAKIGEAIDALVHEDLIGADGAQFGEQVDKSKNGYVGIVEYNEHKIKELFTKVAAPKVSGYYTSAGSHPHGLPK